MTEVHPTIRDHYATINDMLHEKDRLQTEVTRLTNALEVANAIKEDLADRLDNITKERDYYFRKSFAYTNTLVTLKDTVMGMLNIADHEAENSSMAKLPPASQLESKS